VRTVLLLLASGCLALVVEGALATALPPTVLPDVGLLWTVGAALALPAAPALWVAAGMGFGGDLLAGAPLGHGALRLLLAFLAVRIANGALELRRGLPEAVLTGLVSLGVGLFGISLLTASGIPAPPPLRAALSLLVVAAVNAACAPAACWLVEGLASLAGEREAPARRSTILVRTAGYGPGRRLG